MKVKNIILFLLFLFLGATIYAQNTVVRGKVLDENGRAASRCYRAGNRK